jgi:hypothetical protein
MWTRLDDSLHAHPKVLELGGDLAPLGLWALALSHCGAYRTDGHVRRLAAVRLAGSAEQLEQLATSLVRVGLWELHSSGDGWQVHDFLDFNPSRADESERLEELSAKRSQAGQKGAAKRWGGARPADGKTDGKTAFAIGKGDGKPHGNGDSKRSSHADKDAAPWQSDSKGSRAEHGPDPTRPDLPAPLRVAGAAAPLSLSSPPAGGASAGKRAGAKHTSEQIAEKTRVVDAFIACCEATKGIRPKVRHEGEHKAAFELAKTYGAEEACAIVRGAFEREFVVNENTSLRYIASKADTFRGARVAKAGAMTRQIAPASGPRGWCAATAEDPVPQ